MSMRSWLEQQLEKGWYQGSGWTKAMAPLEKLYAHSALKEKVRKQIAAKNTELPLPIVVVGNITVGGTGKSPLVLALAEYLLSRGVQPGILSRGYAADAERLPLLVNAQSSAQLAGDEPLMLAQALEAPVVVDTDRVRGARFLAKQTAANGQPVQVILCDDGLQHYALPRDIEIAVVDGARGLGNGRLLPVGPLREHAERLQRVDMVVSNGAVQDATLAQQCDFSFSLQPSAWRNVLSGERQAIENIPFASDAKVLAVSGIGNPERFYHSLRDLYPQFEMLRFGDHHQYDAHNIKPLFGRSVVMTSKDAVKCLPLAQAEPQQCQDWWVLEVSAQLPAAFTESLWQRLQESFA